MEMTSEKNPAITWGPPDPLQTWKLKNQTQGKVNIFWECHKIWKKNHPFTFDIYYFRARIHRQNSNHSASVTTLSQHNQNGLVLRLRNPDLPVTSLPGPPVPPRSYSQIHLDTMQQNSMYRALFTLFLLSKTILSRGTAKIFSSHTS